MLGLVVLVVVVDLMELAEEMGGLALPEVILMLTVLPILTLQRMVVVPLQVVKEVMVAGVGVEVPEALGKRDQVILEVMAAIQL